MKTRMTELFGIKYPIMLAGMSWVSIPEMVAAVPMPADWASWLQGLWV